MSGLRRSCRRGQSGVALLFVLGAIALTATVMVALLSLSLASSRLTAVQGQQARERRAADAALETGIGRLTRSVANNPCNDLPAGTRADSPAGGPNQPAVEVTLRCRPLPLPMMTIPNQPSADPLGGPPVEIVGTTHRPGVTPPAGGIANPTLVATGADPLRFDADVTVARGANVQASTSGQSGASVAGQYVQGVPGAGSGPTNCGTLDPSAGDVTRSVSDRDQTPVCTLADPLTPRRGSLFSESELVSDRTVGGCPAGSVVAFDPGRYDAVDTAALNNLLDGSCPNRTFWFRPGKYVFDVNDASANQSNGDRHALVIADPTAKIVVGEPSGWSPSTGATAANFPRACDVARSGASFQLTSRTTIRHRAGRVAICPLWSPGSDSSYPAIVQVQSSPSQPVLVSSSPAGLGELPRISTLCFGIIWTYCGTTQRTRTFTTTWASAGSAHLDSAVLLLKSVQDPPVHQAWSSINVRVTSSRLPAPGYCITGFVQLGRTNRQYTAIDLMDPGPIARAGVPTAAEDCRNVLDNQTEAIFEGATIRVDLVVSDYDSGSLTSRCGPAPGCQVTFTIEDVALRTNMVGVAATAATSAHFGTPGGAVALGGDVARVPQNASCIVSDERCRHDVVDTVRSIDVTGFDPAAAGLADADPVEELGVRLEGLTTGLSWASDEIDDTWVRVDLNLPASGTRPARTCSVREDGFSRSTQAIHVDLFTDGGDCRGMVDDVGQLRSSTVRISIRSRCMWIGGARAPTLLGLCNQVRLPEFDRIRLDVTPALTTAAPHAEVTIDATTSGDGSSLNVFGKTLTPDLDLDLRWRGTVTELPVFGDDMSIRSLVSEQSPGAEMGVVCCSPSSVTTLLLEAIVDTEVRAEVQLYVGRPGTAVASTTPTPGAPLRRLVSVLDWKFCQRDCTESQLPAPQVLGTTTVPATPGG